GAACDAAGHPAPLAQRRCLFLNAARIRENSSAVREQVHDVKVGQRIHELHVGESSEEPCNRSTDIGVGMHREDRPHLWMRLREDRKSTRLNSSHEWISYA